MSRNVAFDLKLTRFHWDRVTPGLRLVGVYPNLAPYDTFRSIGPSMWISCRKYSVHLDSALLQGPVQLDITQGFRLVLHVHLLKINTMTTCGPELGNVSGR